MTVSQIAPASSEPEPNPKPTAASRVRLDYLDGLRGLAALYVVFHHAYLEGVSTLRGQEPIWMSRGLRLLEYGHYAVAVFIVLSGYCLMIPVARTAHGRLRGGFPDYIKRRAWRILPPYYAALLISLALIAVVPGLGLISDPQRHWDSSLPAFAPDNLLAHLFVVHNLRMSWIYKINHPMWSVATEWQIYFFFPLLLLPVWRRFGNVALMATALTLGLLPHFALNDLCKEACPWFLALFAFGMAAAAVNFSERPSAKAWRRRPWWGALSALLALIWIAYAWRHPRSTLIWDMNCIWALDILIGASVACLILHCTRHLTECPDQSPPLLLRLFSARGTVFLGTFSYSLYLTHAPLLAILNGWLRSQNVSDTMMIGAMFSAGIPISLLASYAFHRVFERRFMPGHPRTEEQAAKAAALSPAP